MATSSETPVKRSESRRRIGLVGWLWRMGLAVLILLVGLAGTGLIFQAAATRNDQQNPPGELVDVGGYQLHVNCIGNGSSTIILDALGSGSSASWGLVQPEIAQSARVCAYDRAGAGWSERGPTPS